MQDVVPIPPSIWARMLAFIAPGKNGQLQLDVQNGRVIQLRIVETIKPSDDVRVVSLRETG